MSTDFVLAAPFNLRSALHEVRQQARGNSDTVLDVLLRTSPLTAEQLRVQLQAQGGVTVALALDEAAPCFNMPSASLLRELGFVPIRLKGETETRLAVPDPWDSAAAQQAAQIAGTVFPLVAVPGALLRRWLGSESVRPPRQSETRGSSETATAVSSTVVDFVDSAVRAAYLAGASDVHFEYSRTGVTVKLRLDGVMTPHAQLDGKERADEVISRIKVLAQLDITERRTPQDGRFRFAFEHHSIDLRVSIMPSVVGEDAVLRLLDKAQLRSTETTVSLDVLGFDTQSMADLRELAELPHGMLLVTGPTGSGKTTTVYAILSEVNNGQEKIITIEDPVEYELPGVLQIPVNERKGLTFAKGLRSILRHDPDRILVGEIRDAETAEIAVQSALTGHQVFTTVHANSIFDVTGRFRHFGLDMFGFMSSLNGIVVQRLVRRICPHCAGQRAPTEREAKWLVLMGAPLEEVPKAVGCEHCRQTGYRGRLVIAEAHKIDDKFRDLITGNAPVSQLREHVTNTGVKSLSEQAMRLVSGAITTTEEIKRVVGWQ